MAMASIDDVLERLVNDPEFRDQLADDPKAALEGYELSGDDIDVLAGALSADAGTAGGLEPRQSKSAMAQMLGAIFQGTVHITQSTALQAVQDGTATIATASERGRELHRYVSADVSDIDSPGTPEGFEPDADGRPDANHK